MSGWAWFGFGFSAGLMVAKGLWLYFIGRKRRVPTITVTSTTG